ncbi:MAG: hypothetical protein ACP5SI_09795 [Chloroflexia bacterium]
MTASEGGSLILDSRQGTIVGTTPFSQVVQPPARGLLQWAYSLVVQTDPPSRVTVALRDPTLGQTVAMDRSDDGIASIEAVLAERTYELRIESEQSLSFQAICTETYGYRA